MFSQLTETYLPTPTAVRLPVTVLLVLIWVEPANLALPYYAARNCLHTNEARRKLVHHPHAV